MNRSVLVTTSTFDLLNLRDRYLLDDASIDVVLNPFKRRLTADEVAGLLTTDVIGMIAGLEPLTAKVLEGAPNLKVIARCGTGLDSVDLESATKLGISVFNTPDAPTTAVAELTLGHILGLLRHISEGDRRVRSGTWAGLMGSLLQEKTVGIVGYGRIGKSVAKLLLAFGAKVIVSDSLKIDALNVQQVEFGDLLARSDIVSLHVPYTDESRHIIDTEALRTMKPGALVINVSRGGLIDEDALYVALENGSIGGAALDCFETEPYSGPLLKFGNVHVTAHMGSYARETRDQMEIDASAALINGLKEKGLL